MTGPADTAARKKRWRAWRQRAEQHNASTRARAGRGFSHHAHTLVTAACEPEELLEFLEPNLASSVEERTVDRARIKIHFNLESLPPWLQNPEVKPGPLQYFVRLEVSAEELTRAAESWMLELAEFSER